ncbi:hypothetical protein A7U60_g5402 [Sanghuangporus baumii]|uniref:Uncharacterized protein n=1 Tax=Sanghuangporus baumii TaxID=108892 RepID=A0A9Q5N3N0_SANBA|nr:hypothetical protein A7U60_g5402 [Sanghuangporus baumii]
MHFIHVSSCKEAMLSRQIAPTPLLEYDNLQPNPTRKLRASLRTPSNLTYTSNLIIAFFLPSSQLTGKSVIDVLRNGK